MELKITDLLDEYMYDDIPLDEMAAEVHGEPVFDEFMEKRRGHKGLFQIAAAILIVISLSAVAVIQFTKNTAGGGGVSLAQPAEYEAGQADVDQGYTLVIESAYVDGQELYITMRMETEENVDYFFPYIDGCTLVGLDGTVYEKTGGTSSSYVDQQGNVFAECTLQFDLPEDGASDYALSLMVVGLDVNEQSKMDVEGNWSFHMDIPVAKTPEAENPETTLEEDYVEYAVAEAEEEAEETVAMPGLSVAISIGGDAAAAVVDAGISVWNVEVTETEITFWVTPRDDGAEYVIVGGGENFELANAADPDTVYYVLQARTQDGKTVTISGARLSWDEEEGANLFSGQWVEPIDPEEIEKIEILIAE